MAQVNNINLKKFYQETITKHAPYLNHQFKIRFSLAKNAQDEKIDNFLTDVGVDSSVTYFVESSSIPQVQIGEAPVSFLSQQFMVPKVTQHGSSPWNVTLILTNDLKQYNAMYLWQQRYADLEFSGGAQPGYDRSIPDIDALVTLLDSTHQKDIATFKLCGVFPTNLPTQALEYTNSSNVIKVNFTLTYQFMVDDISAEQDYKKTAAKTTPGKFGINWY